MPDALRLRVAGEKEFASLLSLHVADPDRWGELCVALVGAGYQVGDVAVLRLESASDLEALRYVFKDVALGVDNTAGSRAEHAEAMAMHERARKTLLELGVDLDA